MVMFSGLQLQTVRKKTVLSPLQTRKKSLPLHLMMGKAELKCNNLVPVLSHRDQV